MGEPVGDTRCGDEDIASYSVRFVFSQQLQCKLIKIYRNREGSVILCDEELMIFIASHGNFPATALRSEV